MAVSPRRSCVSTRPLAEFSGFPESGDTSRSTENTSHPPLRYCATPYGRRADRSARTHTSAATPCRRAAGRGPARCTARHPDGLLTSYVQRDLQEVPVVGRCEPNSSYCRDLLGLTWGGGPFAWGVEGTPQGRGIVGCGCRTAEGRLTRQTSPALSRCGLACGRRGPDIPDPG